MGGDAQPQLHIQMISGLYDKALDPATVAYQPRWFVKPTSNMDVLVESRLNIAKEMEEMGHRIREVASFDEIMGHEQMIVIDKNNDVKIGVGDPRSDGLALGI